MANLLKVVKALQEAQPETAEASPKQPKAKPSEDKAQAAKDRLALPSKPAESKKPSKGEASNAASFRTASAAARKAGKATFEWQGRKYNTKLKK